jgi:hypothetical protein
MNNSYTSAAENKISELVILEMVRFMLKSEQVGQNWLI